MSPPQRISGRGPPSMSATIADELDCWFDSMHLNSRGVARFAGQIAEDLAPLLKSSRHDGVAAATDTRD